MSFLEEIIGQVNFFGFGPDPLAIAFALTLALFITHEELKEKKYTNTVLVFLSSYAMSFAGQLATRIDLFGLITIILIVGIFLSEKVKVR